MSDKPAKSDPLKDAKMPRPAPPRAEVSRLDADAAAEKAKADAGAVSSTTVAAPEAPELVMPSLGAPPPMDLPMKDGKPLIARRALNAKRVSWFGSFVQIKPGKVCSVAAYGLPGLASFARQGVEFEDIYE